MKLIKPAEISAKIMTLIDEAKKEIIIVSPYNNLTGWTKLINRIKKAQKNGIQISWYSRKNNVGKDNSNEVRALGIEPILIDDLHAKIYFNEEYAIFTSMNMCKSSDDNSIDLGYITETQTEYDNLIHTFQIHISNLALNKNKRPIENVMEKLNSVPEKIENIDSNDLYVNLIHKHICKNYGSFKFNYRKDEFLEYFEFKKPEYKIQVIPYSQALKIHIYFPKNISTSEIEKLIYQKKIGKKLYKPKELEFCQDVNPNYIKYYYEKRYKKLDTWDAVCINEFLQDFDFLVKIFIN
jgi:hypothetical protein